MKEFRWTGKKEGIVVRGSLESESLDDALAILKGREIEVEELVENDQPPARQLNQNLSTTKRSQQVPRPIW